MPKKKVRVIRVEILGSFRRMAKKLKIPDLEERAVKAIMEDPEAGTVVPRSGGLRKIRISIDGAGKRGGARVLYLLLVVKETAVLFGVLSKTKDADFSQAFLVAAKQIALEIKRHARS